MSAPASTVASAVAAWGLPSAHRLPEHPLDDDSFDEVLRACVRNRTLGLLGTAVRADALPTTGPQAEQVEARWIEWLGHGIRAERVAVAATDALTDAGIPSRILKGVALAHTSYPDPAARVFGDVDVLVPGDALHRAGTVLVETLDGTRAEPEVRPGFDDRFGREILVRAGGIEVDLHRTLVNGAYGVRIPLPSLLADPSEIHIGGRPVAVLPPAARLLHAAYQSVLADWPPRLVAFRDLAQVLTHDEPDADAVVATAAAWRGEAVLATGTLLAWRTLRATTRPALVEWAEWYRPRAYDRLLVTAARGRARGYTAGVTTLVALPGIVSRAAYLRAVLAPSREYRDARGLGRLALVGSGARRARRG